MGAFRVRRLQRNGYVFETIGLMLADRKHAKDVPFLGELRSP